MAYHPLSLLQDARKACNDATLIQVKCFFPPPFILVIHMKKLDMDANDIQMVFVSI